MINNNKEYRSCKKWVVGFYIVFMLNLILAGVMLGIMDIAVIGAVWLFAGVFISLSLVSLAVFCTLLHEMNIYVESQKRYYVDTKYLETLVEDFGFHDKCKYLERVTMYKSCVPICLRVNSITGEITEHIDDVEFHDVKRLVTDLAKFNLLHVVQPVL
nr:MAG TPA: hypothetical protein [Inoviridae sp.]